MGVCIINRSCICKFAQLLCIPVFLLHASPEACNLPCIKAVIKCDVLGRAVIIFKHHCAAECRQKPFGIVRKVHSYCDFIVSDNDVLGYIGNAREVPAVSAFRGFYQSAVYVEIYLIVALKLNDGS